MDRPLSISQQLGELHHRQTRILVGSSRKVFQMRPISYVSNSASLVLCRLWSTYPRSTIVVTKPLRISEEIFVSLSCTRVQRLCVNGTNTRQIFCVLSFWFWSITHSTWISLVSVLKFNRPWRTVVQSPAEISAFVEGTSSHQALSRLVQNEPNGLFKVYQ